MRIATKNANVIPADGQLVALFPNRRHAAVPIHPDRSEVKDLELQPVPARFREGQGKSDIVRSSIAAWGQSASPQCAEMPELKIPHQSGGVSSRNLAPNFSVDRRRVVQRKRGPVAPPRHKRVPFRFGLAEPARNGIERSAVEAIQLNIQVFWQQDIGVQKQNPIIRVGSRVPPKGVRERRGFVEIGIILAPSLADDRWYAQIGTRRLGPRISGRSQHKDGLKLLRHPGERPLQKVRVSHAGYKNGYRQSVSVECRGAGLSKAMSPPGR